MLLSFVNENLKGQMLWFLSVFKWDMPCTVSFLNSSKVTVHNPEVMSVSNLTV